MHDVHAQARVTYEHRFQRQRTVQTGAVVAGSEVLHTRRTGSDVNPDGDVELLCQCPDGLETLVVRGKSRVLILELRENSEAALRVELPKLSDALRFWDIAGTLWGSGRNEATRCSSPPFRHPLGRTAQRRRC